MHLRGGDFATAEEQMFDVKYLDCIRKFQCLPFQNSFKLGARIMLEVMEE